MGFTLLIVIIVLALVFDYINGFHDAANSIATVVSTKVLTPFQAVVWAAFFNFLAYWIFHLNVADTVAKTADTMNINLVVILAGVLAAICWNLLTWWFGIPSSSSHTLIGGFAGAAIAHGGLNVVNLGVIGKVASFIVLAPIIGMIMAYFITVIIVNICRYANPSKAEWWFKKLQLVSSALFSLGHGGNDAQKVMGIIAAAIIVYLKDANLSVDTMSSWLHVGYTVIDGKVKINHIPEWIPIACYTAIAAGTMSGGWKIVKTMGTKITKVTPLEGVAAETAGAITLFMTEHFKIPVSTTHTITGAIIGVGLSKRVSAVRWGVTISLLWAWILTIPVSAALAATLYFLLSLFL
ncbi:MAG: anion permease [Sphingobacteriales bacterium 17-39-43]|uniref:inorganic phosphate transporter n=1 Tax=Daejeonella sp. TaxID=2805397 RepID=UPI000BCF64C5|nr:inorganic phosphate transporter [Daejeonella sp.]OYX95671.1 MAG: anion permease [Sphingobacteriia bacterium 35-40-5]OYZ32529.1 MAG: anion permease [Sphingobacteriales bacterium 16-39-50]OZA25892.1 MAG: anion permease [Sphingobacteriales bacterium 17-39-43]HQS52307.1 inorganic phosphate transporter [Daejeonella sp.]HQT21909.1 inorganic phosphate transporter [Daejeonella sp.]